ncbi:hypothetical protein ACWDYJ_09200 [Streptomyces sp. NPDC003042]
MLTIAPVDPAFGIRIGIGGGLDGPQDPSHVPSGLAWCAATAPDSVSEAMASMSGWVS